MNEIIPLVSFPKSGNTWMRFILSNIFKKNKDMHINFNTINDISSTSYNEDHSKMINLLEDKSPLFIKEHYSYYDMPYNNFKKAIYVYRNGFDTLLSYWHFRNAQSPGKYQDIEIFSEYYWNGYRTWGEHLYSWMEDKNTRQKHIICMISYEELISKPVETIDKCLNYLGYKTSIEVIEKAVMLSSKENMKKMSGSSDFMKSKDKKFHFVRSGNTNEGKLQLTDKIKAIFMKDMLSYDMMIKYNYVSKDNKWKNTDKIYNFKLLNKIKNLYFNLRYKFFIKPYNIIFK